MQEEQELPKGWELVTVGLTGQLIRGVTYGKNDVLGVESDASLPILRANNINGHLNYDDLVYLRRDVIKEEQIIKRHDIVIAMSSGSKNLVGKAAQAKADFNGGFGAFCGVFRPHSEVDPNYIAYFFTGPEYRQSISDASKGSNINNLKREHILDLPFPLPPLPEQQRIVAKLEELFSRLDAGVAAVRQSQQLLKRYRQSVLHAAVTGALTSAWRTAHPAPEESGAALLARIRAERRAQWEAAQQAKHGGQLPLNGAWKNKYEEPAAVDTAELPELPEGWVWASMRELGEVRLGRQRAPQHHDGPYMRPYLRVANVYEDRFDLRDVKEMNFTPEEYEIYSLRENDILLNEGQSLELVGRPALYRNEVPGACFTNTLVRYRVCQQLLPKYALSVFRSYLHTGTFQKIASWTTSIAHLGADRFANLHFPLAPLAEQVEIVAEVERRLSTIDALEQTLAAELKRAERLRQSLLHRAFTGRLVPQDAVDEPAGVLLARLQSAAPGPAKAKASRAKAAAAPVAGQAGEGKRRGRPRKVEEVAEVAEVPLPAGTQTTLGF